MNKFWSKKKKSTLLPQSPQNNNISISAMEAITILQLPIFKGDPQEDFNCFIQQLQEAMPQHSEQQKLKILLARLHGIAAEKTIDFLQHDPQPTFVKTTQMLQQCFPNPKERLMHELCQKDENQSFQNYAMQIRKEVNTMFPNKNGHNHIFRERLMVHLFNKGVYQDSQLQNMIENNSLDDAVKHATQISNSAMGCKDRNTKTNTRILSE